MLLLCLITPYSNSLSSTINTILLLSKICSCSHHKHSYPTNCCYLGFVTLDLDPSYHSTFFLSPLGKSYLSKSTLAPKSAYEYLKLFADSSSINLSSCNLISFFLSTVNFDVISFTISGWISSCSCTYNCGCHHSPHWIQTIKFLDFQHISNDQVKQGIFHTHCIDSSDI